MPWKNTFKCSLCNRPMPPRVYEAHLKKSHTPEEVAGIETANLGKVPETATELKIISENHSSADPNIEVEVIKKEFDWGEVYPCASCGAEYPAKAMDFHSKVVHGV